MTNILKRTFRKEYKRLNLRIYKFLKQSLLVLFIIIGWLLMIVGAPIVALNTPSEGFDSIIGSFSVLYTFYLGTHIAGYGIEKIEEENRVKAARNIAVNNQQSTGHH